MTDKIFIDSNVWIYLFTSDDKDKNVKAKQFIRDNSNSSVFIISYQVINEVSSVLKKKKFTETQIQFVIKMIAESCVIQNFSIEIVLAASSLREKLALSFWDSLVIASANAAQCSMLVSEDMQNGQIIERTLTIKNPFV
jgi:predicted nucleic acid-binding protein